MSTYTTTYSCGHSRNDPCQHCKEDTNYVSPGPCPACQTIRWPSFGPLPCYDGDDDHDDHDEEEDEDEDMNLDDDESGDYVDEDETEDQDTDMEDVTPASSLENMGLSPVSSTPRTESSSPPSSLLERKMASYGVVLREVRYCKPMIVVLVTRPVEGVAVFEWVDDEKDEDDDGVGSGGVKREE